jgi:small subunit ribosomal protein S18
VPFVAPGGPGGRPGAGPRRRPGEFGTGRKFTPRRKVCQFCVDKIKEVDYKDLVRLRRFLSERGKIEPRRKTGTCAAHQRSLNVALKRARQLALLPFTAEHIRVTGVLVREPGVPPFRGARPRPQEVDGAAEAEAPAAASEASTDGQAAPAATEPTVAEPTAAEPIAAEPAGEVAQVRPPSSDA